MKFVQRRTKSKLFKAIRNELLEFYTIYILDNLLEKISQNKQFPVLSVILTIELLFVI